MFAMAEFWNYIFRNYTHTHTHYNNKIKLSIEMPSFQSRFLIVVLNLCLYM